MLCLTKKYDFFIFIGTGIAKRLDEELERHNHDIKNNGKNQIDMIHAIEHATFLCGKLCTPSLIHEQSHLVNSIY